MVPHTQRGIIRHPAQVYGYSVRGAPLEVYLPEGKTECLVFAGIHGEEAETTILLSRALRSRRHTLQHCAVILAANPDGLALGTRANANGVDLNRNFPARNWREGHVCHRWSEGCAQEVVLSTGSAPASEPETLALMQLVERLSPAYLVALHGPLACIDDPQGSALGCWLAEASGLPLVADIGSPTPGSFGSWCQDQGRAVITYELPPDSVWALQAVHLPLLSRLLDWRWSG
ncbi:MAG: murein tripeptide amidase MpaA [Thiothrix sp.]|nr:murein tripeptide amidase MpaA [Thiothrix sp.]